MQIREKIAFCLLVVFSATLMVGLAFAANKAPEGDISIHSGDVFKNFKQGPVLFPHAKHKALKCKTCHHDYKDGKNVWQEGEEVKKCSACHKLEANGKVVKLEKAYHESARPVTRNSRMKTNLLAP